MPCCAFWCRIELQCLLPALQVPVIGFGENELYHMREVKPGSMRDKLQRFVKAAFGFTLPNAVGQGLFFGEWYRQRDLVLACRHAKQQR
jgi:hypothetical protein